MATRQFVRAGFDRREPAIWVLEGLAIRLLHGLYARADQPEPPERSVLLPLRYLDLRRPAGHHPALISGAAGLAVHGAEGFALPAPPLVLVDERSRVRADAHPFDVRRTDLGRLPADEVRGVRVAPPWRAVADAALDDAIADRELRVAVDSLRNRREIEIVSAARAWAESGHRGGRRMSAMVDTGVFEQESEGEREAFRLLFGRGGAPLPDCQVVLLGQLRVDFVFLHAGLVVEYHGRVHDGRADEDASRIAALEHLGLRVLLASKSMPRNPDPHAARIEAIRRDRLARARSGALPLPPIPAQPARLTPLRTILPPAERLVLRTAA